MNDRFIVRKFSGGGLFAIKREERQWWLSKIPVIIKSHAELIALATLSTTIACLADDKGSTIDLIKRMSSELLNKSVPFVDIDKQEHPNKNNLQFANHMADILNSYDLATQYISPINRNFVHPRINACPLGWELGNIALIEAIHVVLAVADRKAGSLLLDEIARRTQAIQEK